MVSGAHCIRGAGAGVPAESSWPPPRNPGRVHRSVFLSLRFVKKIAISPCPFFWPLMMASPPPPSPGGRGVRERRALGAGWWWAGRVSRLQATPSTGCPGRGTWRRSWRKAAEKVGVGSLGWTPSPPLGARPAGNCMSAPRQDRACASFSSRSCCGDSRRPLAASPSHREKGALETKGHDFKSRSLLATGDRGPHTSLLGACCASRTHRVPGTVRGAFLETFSETRKTETHNLPKVTQLQARKPGFESRHLTPEPALTT